MKMPPGLGLKAATWDTTNGSQCCVPIYGWSTKIGFNASIERRNHHEFAWNDTMTTAFRHSAGFGKRIEYWVIGRMLKEGMDVYIPLVDDHAVDAIVRRKDGSIALVQIKARSSTVASGDAALFAAIPHEHRPDYWFVFYSERLDTTFLMTSEEFIEESVQNKNGKNVGLRAVWFNGRKTDRKTKEKTEYIKDRYLKYVVSDFSRIAHPSKI